MGKDVFANGMEVSGKASDNKSLAAMPDVCLSPPAPPAGPIPIPYPNTSMASRTTAGSRRVKIGKEEVGLKNKSKYKDSNGDEPATNNFGAGVITHKITGPVKFSAWSMDVKFEGANVTRFMDLTTHNHANPGNGAMTSSIAGLFTPTPETQCHELSDSNDKARADMKSGKHGGELATLAGLNTTITHSVFTPTGGSPVMMRGFSRQSAHQYDNSWQEGLTKDEKDNLKNENGKVKSQACGDHTYNRAYHMPHTSHTESRILEDIFRQHPTGDKRGKLLMSIDWPGGATNGTPKSPCVECQALICEAVKCIDIEICDEQENPRDAREMCESEPTKGKKP
jgi:hypothetical protein